MVKTRKGKEKDPEPEPFGGVTETEAMKWLKKLAVNMSATLKQHSTEMDCNLPAHFRAYRTSSYVGVVTRKRKLSEVFEESPQVSKHDSKKLKIQDSEASPQAPKHASEKLKIEEREPSSAVHSSRKKSSTSGKGKGKATKTQSNSGGD